jgi:hypothetical protein
MALIARTTLFAKKETSYGTDVYGGTAAGTDGILALNVRPDPRFASLVRNVQRASLGKLPPVSETGGSDPGGGISFDVEIRGPGAAATAPRVSPLLQACGLTETLGTGTAGSASYAPASSGIPGCTIYAYMDGILWKLVGCRGNVKLTLQAGQVGLYNFTFQALTIGLADQGLLTGTYETTSPPSFVKYGTVSSLKIDTGDYEAIVQRLEVDLGNRIEVAPNANAPNNRNEIVLAERDVGGSFDPEMVPVATYDFWSKMKQASAIALTAQVGGTQWNKLLLTATKMVLGQIGLGERAGKRAFTIPFKLAETNGDDELMIAFQ